MRNRLALVVVNPISGRSTARRIAPYVQRELERYGLDVKVVETAQPGDGERAVRMVVGTEMMRGIVVAVGGDGTIGEVVRGVGGSGAAVGMIPVGTANILARELGIPRSVRRACTVIARERTRALDLGHTDRGDFLSVGGAGFDAHVVACLARLRDGAAGYRAYLGPIVEAIRTYTFPRFTVEVDGQVVAEDATSAVVSNIRQYGGLFCLTPRAVFNDGLLDVCVFRCRTWLGHLVYMSSAILSLHLFIPGVSYHRGRHVALKGPSSVPVQLDGDARGSLPVEFEVIPRAVRVLVP